MSRRRHFEFGDTSALEVLIWSKSVGALAFIFLMFFIITSGLVDPTQLRFLVQSLPDGVAGRTYDTVVGVTGGSPPYKWSISDGDLPPGLSLDRKAGVVSGSPTKDGSYKLTVRATDSSKDQPVTVNRPFSLRIRPTTSGLRDNNLALDIATARLPAASVGHPYHITLAALGGSEPYAWKIRNLPRGLVLRDDRIIGSPKASGKWRMVARVRDQIGVEKIRSLTLEVEPQVVMNETQIEPLGIITRSLPEGALRKNYSTAPAIFGGVPPYSWTITKGNLPYGMSMDPQTGVITGKPIAAGKSRFLLTVSDSQKEPSKTSKNFNLRVASYQYVQPENTTNISWSEIALIVLAGAVGLFVVIAILIGVQCPWDRSWRCKVRGKDEQGRNIYTCKHGHSFVHETRLMSEET